MNLLYFELWYLKIINNIFILVIYFIIIVLFFLIIIYIYLI